jgi:hypothetical protein
MVAPATAGNRKFHDKNTARNPAMPTTVALPTITIKTIVVVAESDSRLLTRPSGSTRR